MTRKRLDEIVACLQALFQALDTVFSQEEISEVRHFVDVGEFGLALDTAIDVILEENKKVPTQALLAIERAADLMGNRNTHLQELRKHVQGE